MLIKFFRDLFKVEEAKQGAPQYALNLTATNFFPKNQKRGTKKRASLTVPFSYTALFFLVQQLDYINRCSNSVVDKLMREDTANVSIGVVEDGVYIVDSAKTEQLRSRLARTRKDWRSFFLDL